MDSFYLIAIHPDLSTTDDMPEEVDACLCEGTFFFLDSCVVALLNGHLECSERGPMRTVGHFVGGLYTICIVKVLSGGSFEGKVLEMPPLGCSEEVYLSTRLVYRYLRLAC